MKRFLAVLAAALATAATPVHAVKWSGYAAAEARAFTHSALDPRQHDSDLSLVFEPELYHGWDDRRQSFTFVPHFRLDRHDEERSHFDIRELTWVRSARDWELRVGVRKVFWGVTESQHLVDIINQTDLVENPDGEDKLGQPMINLALIRNFGTLDLFLLPGFRERSFPGIDGRLRAPLPVDTNQAVYESGAGDRRVDTALRWYHSIGVWDIGLSHFHGTSREPRLLPGVNGRGEAVLIPYYDIIDQTGIDLQATRGSWLWKLEAIRRAGQGDAFVAAVGGFEYTFYGLAGSRRDLGLVAEYHYDERGNDAPTPFQDDLMLGLRLTLNDAASSEALLGMVVDSASQARLISLEASRRFGRHWKLSLEGRVFAGLGPADPLYPLRDDDYLQLELAYHF